MDGWMDGWTDGRTMKRTQEPLYIISSSSRDLFCGVLDHTTGYYLLGLQFTPLSDNEFIAGATKTHGIHSTVKNAMGV